jgi:MAF protein
VKLVLASSSPRRQQLLRHLFSNFEIRPVHIDESPLPMESPRETALRLARLKAELATPLENEVVVAADTVVAIDSMILGKPSTPEEAGEMLRLLRGKQHTVYTGVAAIVDARSPWLSAIETVVAMRVYSDAEIEAYVASGSPMDKAGAYGVQDTDFSPVAKYMGCYLNVVGLPLCEVVRGLKALQFPDAQHLSWKDIETLCPTCTHRRLAGEEL